MIEAGSNLWPASDDLKGQVRADAMMKLKMAKKNLEKSRA
jgi:hypothetical protein